MHTEGEATAGLGTAMKGKAIGHACRDDGPWSLVVVIRHFAPSSAVSRCGDVFVAVLYWFSDGVGDYRGFDLMMLAGIGLSHVG